MEINQYSRDHLLMSIFGVSSGYLRGEGKAEMSELTVSNWCSCRIDKIYLFQKKYVRYLRMCVFFCTFAPKLVIWSIME